MSRIHDALKRAEQERQTGASTLRVEESSPENILASAVLHEQSLPEAHASKMDADVRLSPMGGSRDSEPLLAQATQTDWTLDPKLTLSFEEQDQAIDAESFRTLRSHLKLVQQQRPLKTILVASALPKEGKTFIAANLAQAITWQQRDRVLLIDGDLRAPSLHKCLGAPQSPGLAEYMRGEVNDFSFVQRSGLDNFFFIPSGHSNDKSSELIGNGRLKFLLEELAPLFDWIIIDSSPAVPVSDAKLTAELCDGVLMVVRSGQTPADAARRVAQELRGKRFLGVILNYSDQKLRYGSYSYNNHSEKTNGSKVRSRKGKGA